MFLCRGLKRAQPLHRRVHDAPRRRAAVRIVERQVLPRRGAAPLAREKGEIERDLRLVLRTLVEGARALHGTAHIALSIDAVRRNDGKMQVEEL